MSSLDSVGVEMGVVGVEMGVVGVARGVGVIRVRPWELAIKDQEWGLEWLLGFGEAEGVGVNI